MTRKKKSTDFNEFTPDQIERLISETATLIQTGRDTGIALPRDKKSNEGWQLQLEWLAANAKSLVNNFRFASGQRHTKSNDPWIGFAAAIKVARFGHKNQLLKSNNKAYIGHPAYVSSRLENPYDKQVAILHDLLEKTNITAEHLLRMGFKEDVVDDVVLLTHNKNGPYLDYIERVGRSLRAGRIKIEDIKHNMQPGRAIPGEVSEWMMWKRECYQIALPYLQAIQDGKIRPGTSIVEYLTTEPYEFLLGNKPRHRWTGKEVKEKAEQLHVMERVLRNMSSDAPGLAVYKETVDKLIAQRLLPPRQQPEIFFPDDEDNSGTDDRPAADIR